VVEPLFAEGLLGRHVLERPDEDAAIGAGAAVGDLGARDAEVDELHRLFARDHREEDVGRLEIAVDDPGGVDGVEPLGDLAEEPGDRADREAALARQLRAEVLAVEELHDHVGVAAIDAIVVGLHDVRALDVRHGARLALEAHAGVVVAGGDGVDELDGHVAPELAIEGHPERAHAPRGQLALEAVFADDHTPRSEL
jgi:hypothetical protein